MNLFIKADNDNKYKLHMRNIDFPPFEIIILTMINNDEEDDYDEKK